MFSKLEDSCKRYDELVELMARPEVASDHRKFQTYAQEVAGLKETIETYRAYTKSKDELAESKLLLEDEDAEIRAMAKDDIVRLNKTIANFEEQLKLLMIPKDPHDGKNVILEIRAGTGGDEAGLFAGDLFRMYVRYAENMGWKVEVLSSSAAPQGGYKEVISLVKGVDAYRHLKYESGVHRVQRVPQTETQGRVHTSAVTVAVLPEADEVEVKIDDKDLQIDVYRSSGPGGQSVNTTDSAVRITHIPTGLVVTCQDEKSQIKNKAKALKILTSRLLAKMEEEQEAEISAQRRGMVGTGDRSERIRTYNFPQGRVTDHRINLTLYKLDRVILGDLEELISALIVADQAEKLKSQSEKEKSA